MRTFTNDGMTFSVVDGGPGDAPEARTVVLLHGFPETSAAWGPVSERLHADGLRTLAPDTRGVSAGARPRARSMYRIERVVGDVVALLDAAGLGSIHLVGHDWGGAIAWEVARRHPERLRTLTVLSTPHPAALRWAMRHSTQGLKSWYMLAFQVPVLPERVLAWGIERNGLDSLALPPEQAAAYVHALSQPGALTGALGPYRGMFTRGTDDARVSESRPITLPATFIWGNRDPFLGRAAAERTVEHCRGDYRFVEVDADHWLPEKQSALVADEIRRRVFDDFE